ncbi:MAG TPA: ABC transporter ATP-binding protein [Acidimicrobiia bacterium]|nr:ABC transporter ATP-binding protein [Acidimicrobiia bacterium]
MGAAVRAHELTVTIDDRRLLDGVSFAVEPGEWLFVLGPNGAGKTTLLRALAGLVALSSGEIDLMEQPLSGMRPRDRARTVALVPQAPGIPAGMTVLDYVLLGRTPHFGLLAHEGRHDVDAARDALATLGLSAFAGRTVSSLSGGERQRVVVGRALAQRAPVLLLDEPTTSLDIGHQQDVLELVDELRRARDVTVIATMHDLTLAGQYADRLVLLRDGRIVQEGLAHEVMTEESLSRYYGARVNVIDGPDGIVVVPHRRPPGAGS